MNRLKHSGWSNQRKRHRRFSLRSWNGRSAVVEGERRNGRPASGERSNFEFHNVMFGGLSDQARPTINAVFFGHALLTAHFLVLEFATTASKIKRSDFMSFRQIYIHTWNPNDPCIGWKRPCLGGLILKNRGHLGSRYILLSFQISAGRHPVFHNH